MILNNMMIIDRNRVEESKRAIIMFDYVIIR